MTKGISIYRIVVFPWFSKFSIVKLTRYYKAMQLRESLQSMYPSAINYGETILNDLDIMDIEAEKERDIREIA